MDIGSAVGRAAGVTDAQLRALPEYRKSSRFSELERLVLDYAVAMTATPVDVSETLFGDLRRHFNDEQMIELTATIAWENYRARFDHALGIEAQGFSDGAYSVSPETPRRRSLLEPLAKPRGRFVRTHRLEVIRTPHQVRLVNEAIQRRERVRVAADGAADRHGAT